MRTTLALLTASLLLMMAGCDSAPKTSDKDVEPISYRKLKELMADASEGKPLVIIDVRTLSKFEEGHIPGAINVWMPDLKRVSLKDPRVEDASGIVVYGDGFADSLSPIGAKDLISRGFENVYDFRGGWQKWQAEQKLESGDESGGDSSNDAK